MSEGPGRGTRRARVRGRRSRDEGHDGGGAVPRCSLKWGPRCGGGGRGQRCDGCGGTRVDELRDFALHEGDWVHHALGADHVDLLGREEPARAQVEVVLDPGLADHRVARVLAAVYPGDHLDLRVACDRIDRLALALVTKVRARYHYARAILDHRPQDRLLRRLHVGAARHIVQLRDALEALDSLPGDLTFYYKLLVVAHVALALFGVLGRGNSLGRVRGKVLLLLVTLLILLVKGVLPPPQHAAPQRLLLIPLLEYQYRSDRHAHTSHHELLPAGHCSLQLYEQQRGDRWGSVPVGAAGRVALTHTRALRTRVPAGSLDRFK